MLRIILILLLAGQASISQGLDFGDLLKRPAKQGQKDEGEKTKTSARPELMGIMGGTSMEEEIAIGKEVAGRLLGASPLVNNEELQLYVNKVGKWVAMQCERDELQWHFGVIETKDINAFAAPGGYIFVTQGLFAILNNEAELAGVLAHEIGHVIKKHHLNILKKGKAIDLGKNLVSERIGEGRGQQAVKNLVGNGAEIMARGLDKEAEYEADRIGVVLATRAGYDSYGLPTVLQEIGHVSAGDGSVQLLFKTHPHPSARLASLGDAMGDGFDKFSDGKMVEDRFLKISQ